MSIKFKIREIMFESDKGQLLFYKIRRIREWYALKTLTDYDYVKKTYKERYGVPIDLVNPKGFGEKLQWLKLFYRDEWMPICSDKYEIRQYLKQFGYEKLANKVIGVYEDARDIPYEQLPQKFVAKATHGSGWNLICKDKNALDWSSSVKLMNSWLKLDLSVFGREWNYKEIKPRIVVEEFIEHEPLNDYKLMCFNGEPMYVQLNNDYEGVHYVDFYDISTWKHLPVTFSAYQRSNRDLEKPDNLEKMMEIARVLSKRFPFVRVDFYSFDHTIILGELTFFPGGGMWPFTPKEEGYNELLGEKLILPEPNNNHELLHKLHGYGNNRMEK